MKSALIARPDILALKPYQAGEQVSGAIRLNANEAPIAAWDDANPASLNRYPEARPFTLQNRLSALFAVAPEHLLVTRGSSEAIDVLIRSFCHAYRDAVITAPPTFEMYRVYAEIQGVEMIDVPLDDKSDFSLDPEGLLKACTERTKLIFLCSPNNPTGSLVKEADVRDIAGSRRGKSIVVIDEAYVEFSGNASLSRLVGDFDNLVVLRTLSKAHGLAGARCGVAIACADLIGVMGRVLPPYTFPTPVVDTVMAALEDDRIARSTAAIAEIVSERQRVSAALRTLGAVDKVWPSAANFILVRFRNLVATTAFLQAKNILIRDFSSYPMLDNCARITIGTRAENDALLQALATSEEQSP